MKYSQSSIHIFICYTNKIFRNNTFDIKKLYSKLVIINKRKIDEAIL
jgi:hypothetical protein